MRNRTLRQVAVAVLLLVSFLFQGTWALAGTTGGITGQLVETSGAPLAGAEVTATSPSQQATAKTDSAGHFAFLALAPDTYTLSIQKTGYEPISYTGVSVFADNTLTLSFKMSAALQTIAKVTSRSAGDIVKSGVTADIYAVNSTQIQKTSALGGGGNLDSAYSAIAAVPGVNVPSGGAGWGQNVYIRGAQGFFTGFEYDGIPVNRSFDNYNSSTESSLGLQQLQVYTGGGPASDSSSGTSGFVNQVIKTGTYPGYADAEVGEGADAFYHKLKIEAGGATPDRRFSYYVGLSGDDQAVRFLNNQNGANYMTPGGIYGDYLNSANFTGNMPGSYYGGALGACQPNSINPQSYNAQTQSVAPGAAQNCLIQYSGLAGLPSYISDRENIVNFHFAIPQKNGLRDDLQLLYSASSMHTDYYGSANDLGTAMTPTGYTSGQNMLALLTGSVNYTQLTPSSPLYGTLNPQPGALYANATVYNAPFGTPISGLTKVNYLQPSAVETSPYIPSSAEDSIWNDTGVVKLQYTHELTDHSYLRAFAYSMFSDWTQSGANGAAGYYYGYYAGASPNYDLITHTVGGEIQFADQINAKNLVQLTGNYTQASVNRFNNTGYLTGSSPIGLISGSGNNWTCYTPTATGSYAAGSAVPCYSSAYKSTATAGPTGMPPAGSPAALAGAQWSTLWQGEASGTYNTVQPKFGVVSLTDDFRPTDKILINAGLRFENYTYDLQNSNTPANDFYANIVSNYSCWSPANGVLTAPLQPGVPPPAAPLYTAGNCQAGYVHPNGVQGQNGVTYSVPNFTATSPSAYSQSFYSLRLSGTYTQSPDTVWRVSGGRYTAPPISASEQYLYSSGAGSTLWSNFENLGFFSPAHNIPAMSSAQYDLSLERHIRGTDWSFKISPFYSFTNGYQGDAFIGQGFVTQVPIGVFRTMGVEGSVTKGDFARNGFSGMLSVTYTKAQMQYQSEFGGAYPNQVSGINSAINYYNGLTKAGGGAPCYTPAKGNTPGVADPSCAATSIVNPYYNSAPQGQLNTSGWYPAATYAFQPGVNTSAGYYDSPWVASIVMNYRHDKFAITPSLQFTEGTSYGSPYDVMGLDPTYCGANQAATGAVAAGSAAGQLCDYTQMQKISGSPSGYMYIPNPQTGSFATLGAYREPSMITGNLQMSYDISPRISARLTLADLFHTCFGGTQAPWTTAYPTGSSVCGYYQNSLYVSNYQNGVGQLTPGNTASYDPAANGGTSIYNWQQQSYRPSTGSPAANGAAGAQIPMPFNAYFELQVKL